ncbi:MAG: phosphoglycerate dehydrogenase, partial [Cytophagales bacterium]|nr:phosphoglycerate dehydrogenase [Cytophagales bacterium]
MRKVLIVDEVHPSMEEGLSNLGFVVETRTDLSLAEFSSILPSYEGLVVRSKFKITSEILKDTSLAFIARAGAGLDLLDVDACQSRG